MDVKERLQYVINDITNGNKKKFAEEAGVNQSTLQNYLKGRTPKADALEKICKTYKVNLNWLVAGIGERYLNGAYETSKSTDGHKNKNDEYLELIGRWLAEYTRDDPRNKIWFERQFEKLFPEFDEWLQKANELNKQKVA